MAKKCVDASTQVVDAIRVLADEASRLFDIARKAQDAATRAKGENTKPAVEAARIAQLNCDQAHAKVAKAVREIEDKKAHVAKDFRIHTDADVRASMRTTPDR